MTTRLDAESWVCDVQQDIAAFGGDSGPAGQTTSVQNTTPWSGQIPFLTGGGTPASSVPGTNGNTAYDTSNQYGVMPAAESLYANYVPQYYPGSTYAAPTAQQNQAISGITTQATGGEPVTGAAMDYNTGLLNGNYLNSNPGSYYETPLAEGSAIYGNPANGTLSTLGNAATYGALTGSAPGSSTFNQFANGSMLGTGNPYFSSMADTVASSVVPSIESQFINGGGLSTPDAAFATSQGLSNALAPIAEQNYTTNEGLMLQGAQGEGANYFSGLGAGTSAAGTLGSNYLGGANLEGSAGNTISGNYNSGVTAMNQGLFASPSTQTMPYTDLDQLCNAGSTQQNLNQGQLNANINAYNYNQMLPYNLLDQYASLVNGNYGGETALTEPYFENGSANTMSQVTSGLGTAAMIAMMFGA